MRSHAQVTWGILVTAAVFFLAGAAHAGEEHHAQPKPPGGELPAMARFYAGTLVRVGDFPGRLVCLRCDLKPGATAAAQCEKEGHRHALSMDSDSMVHPLLPASEDVLTRINSPELHGKQVTVHGRYFSSTEAILVDRVTATP